MLEPTGERIIEEYYQQSVGDYLIYLFHMATYEFAKQFVQQKRVLDYGCGSGYGTAMIAGGCKTLIGVDISSEAIAYAKTHFIAENLSYQTIEPADLAPLPFDDASFDSVLSIQVIEHIRNPVACLCEIRRVLRLGGHLIIATPDRDTRLLPFQKPWNVWHVIEYSLSSLQDLLSGYFSEVEVLKMGGNREVLQIELARTARLKWLTLPFTLPFVPESVRIWFLQRLKALRKKTATAPVSFGFDQSALRISADAEPSVNLIAVVRKGQC